MKDFFISYTKADKAWAEWIAWTLEEAGLSVIIQAWDFRPGGNFVLDMQRAASETEKTIVVLSPAYLEAEYTQPEWAAAFVPEKAPDAVQAIITNMTAAWKGAKTNQAQAALHALDSDSVLTSLPKAIKEQLTKIFQGGG
jgi:hypothetical protein